MRKGKMNRKSQSLAQSTEAHWAEHPNQGQFAGISAARPTITPLPRPGEFELAPQQENWWLHEFLFGHIHPNNVHLDLRLTGSLRLGAIERSVASLQRRHEALRTAFVPRDRAGAAVLITPPDVCELPIFQIDLSQLDPNEQSGLLGSVSQQERERPFDLTRGNLCRVVLIRLAAEDHVIVFTIHHLVFDEWSMDILMRDFSAIYASTVKGAAAQLPPLAFQYVDFAHWQRNWLSSPAAAKQFSYWRHRLAPPLPPLLPSADNERELIASSLVARGRVPLVIGASAAGIARRLARSERCTFFSTLIAIVKTLLYAYSRQTDIRVGTPVVNRNLPGAENVVGLFTNIICLRSKIDPTSTFREFLRGVNETVLDATDNQDLPYEIMIRDLEASQQTPRDGLLHAMVLWMTIMSPQHSEFPGIEVNPSQAGWDTSESVVFIRNTIDLRFELTETPMGIVGNITYNLSRFSVTDIHGMAAALERCLTHVEEYPEVTMGRLCEHLSNRSVRLKQE